MALVNPARTDPRLRGLIERLDAVVREGGAGPSGTEPERLRAEEVLARVAWNRLAEPGDGVAGVLLEQLGAWRALEMLVESPNPAWVRAAFAEGGVEIHPKTAAAAVDRWWPRLDREAVQSDIERGAEAGLSVLLPGDPLWPEPFADLGAHAPLLLWTHGNQGLLGATGLAVVGARAASGYGTHVTADLVDGISARGIAVVSGAAYGIDAVAHRAALAAGGATIAVLAGGVDRPYPEGNRALITRIAAEGLVCSEMIPGSAPTRWRFLQRNRLIAALAAATLVTEAGMRSGTLNTAGHAAELGRPLGAVPGPITSVTSAGCHRLIREYGAALITGVGDACELLGAAFDELDPLVAGGVGAGSSRPPALHRRLLDAIPLRGSRSFEDIVRAAGTNSEEARGGLAELELLGNVMRCETPGQEEPGWRLLKRE